MPFIAAKEPTSAEQVLELLKKNQPMSEPDRPPFSDYKYWAFISYSHQDNLATRGDGGGDHIRWANWLHEQLETFRIPDGYRERTTRSGEPMPERFFPTFRDEAELPTSHDLGGQIRDALERSRFLIVITSPRSARSRYVNKEVRYFRELGRGDRILTLIVDGEPNVRLTPKAGWTAGDDCFCPALVHPLRPDGSVDETARLPEEPIAADVRVKDVEPPREMHASERDQPDRRALLDFMKLKLIAGLMGVGLDELVQRDKQRQLEAARRRTKTLRRWLSAVGLLAVLAVAAAAFAWLNKREADRQKTIAETNATQAQSAKNRAVAAKKDADKLISYMQHDVSGMLEKVGRIKLMDGINRRIRQYHDEHPLEPGNLDGAHELRTSLLQRGDVLHDIGQLAEALKAYREGLAIAERSAAADPADVIWQRDLSECYGRIGRTLRDSGKLGEALQAYGKGMEITERNVKTRPDNYFWQADLSITYNNLGVILWAQGDRAGAMKAFRDALEIAERLDKQNPKDETWQTIFALSHDHVGDILREQGDLTAALKNLQASVAIRKRLLDSEPDNVVFEIDLSNGYEKVGDVFRDRGEMKAALGSYKDSLSIRQRLANGDSVNSTYQCDLARSYERVGYAFNALDDTVEAAKNYRDSIMILVRLTEFDPANTGWQSALAASFSLVGDMNLYQGYFEASFKAYRRSQEITERLSKADPRNADWQRDLAITFEKTGDLQIAGRNFADALKSYRSSHSIVAQFAKADPQNAARQLDLANSGARIARVLLDQGGEDRTEAIQLISQGISILDALEKINPPSVPQKQTRKGLEMLRFRASRSR